MEDIEKNGKKDVDEVAGLVKLVGRNDLEVDSRGSKVDLAIGNMSINEVVIIGRDMCGCHIDELEDEGFGNTTTKLFSFIGVPQFTGRHSYGAISRVGVAVHCLPEKGELVYFIQDLGTLTGTFVNDKKLGFRDEYVKEAFNHNVNFADLGVRRANKGFCRLDGGERITIGRYAYDNSLQLDFYDRRTPLQRAGFSEQYSDKLDLGLTVDLGYLVNELTVEEAFVFEKMAKGKAGDDTKQFMLKYINEMADRKVYLDYLKKEPLLRERDAWAILGTSPTTDKKPIKAAYYARIQQYHPDKFADFIKKYERWQEFVNGMASKINHAYERTCQWADLKSKGN